MEQQWDNERWRKQRRQSLFFQGIPGRDEAVTLALTQMWSTSSSVGRVIILHIILPTRIASLTFSVYQATF